MKRYVKYLLLVIVIFGMNLITVEAKDFIVDSIDDVEPNSYVIGSHVFTSDTELVMGKIMLASKSISSDKIEDMKIYYKDPWGEWNDAISGNSLSEGEIKKIPTDLSYINLVFLPYAPSIDTSIEQQLKYVGGKYIYSETFQPSFFCDGIELYKETKNGNYSIIKSQVVVDVENSVDIKFEMQRGEKANFYFRKYKLVDGDRYYSMPSKFNITAPEEDLDSIAFEEPEVSVTMYDIYGVETEIKDISVAKTLKIEILNNNMYDGIVFIRKKSNGSIGVDLEKETYYEVGSSKHYDQYVAYFSEELYIQPYILLSNGQKHYSEQLYLVK